MAAQTGRRTMNAFSFDAAGLTGLLARFKRCEQGATSIEYALICSCIFVAIVVAVQNFAAANAAMYNNIKNKI